MLPSPSSPLGEIQPPTSKIAVLAKGSQNPVSRPDEESSQISVSMLRDAQRWVAFPRLALSSREPEERSHGPTLLEPVRIAQREHEGERGQRAHSVDLGQSTRLRVGALGAVFDPPLGVADLFGELLEYHENRVEGGT